MNNVYKAIINGIPGMAAATATIPNKNIRTKYVLRKPTLLLESPVCTQIKTILRRALTAIRYLKARSFVC